jgi:hypothetical protein
VTGVAGDDTSAPLDARLRAKGVEGVEGADGAEVLRVADSSVMWSVRAV